jgi:DNA-binding NtrC family response regulator
MELHPDWQVRTVSSTEEAGEAFIPDLAVIVCPGGNPEESLESLRHNCRRLPILVADPTASASDAARYMRLGAHDVAGFGDDLRAAVEAMIELHFLPSFDDHREPWSTHLIGSSAAMEPISTSIRLLANRRTTVLITGETGTGKELVARALHMASPRSHLPLVAVNCNALPDSLVEAELFGYVKGAFTGAIQQRVGRFEQAHRGTLFLDEIGDLPLSAQAKLLRVLQEREFQRVGSSETIRVDVRLIAATNLNLMEGVREGKFREDLYYRLNVVSIRTPPLRERREDIPLLAHHFIEKICSAESLPAPRLTPEIIKRLKSYDWPGNIRQLENAIEAAIIMSAGRAILYPSDFDLEPARPLAQTLPVPDGGLDFEKAIGGIERQLLEETLRKTKGNKTAAAEMLGLKRTTLAAKLKSLGAAAG